PRIAQNSSTAWTAARKASARRGSSASSRSLIPATANTPSKALARDESHCTSTVTAVSATTPCSCRTTSRKHLPQPVPQPKPGSATAAQHSGSSSHGSEANRRRAAEHGLLSLTGTPAAVSPGGGATGPRHQAVFLYRDSSDSFSYSLRN